MVQSTCTNVGTGYLNDLMKKQQVFTTWIICSKFDQLHKKYEQCLVNRPLANRLQARNVLRYKADY